MLSTPGAPYVRAYPLPCFGYIRIGYDVFHRCKIDSLIITSNQPFSHWDQIFPDTLMKVAAIDRIIHHATIVEIDADSYRKNTGKRRKPAGD